VRFNHYEKRWGKHFSGVEIGKTSLYEYLRGKGELYLYEGFQTSEARTELGLKKSSSKDKRCVESHVTDAVTLCQMQFGTRNTSVPEFIVIKRPILRRRSLHLQNPAKGGVRRVHGGTTALGIKKNTVALWKGELVRTGGSTKGRISVHNMSLDRKRISYSAKVEDLKFLFHQTLFTEVLELGKSIT